MCEKFNQRLLDTVGLGNFLEQCLNNGSWFRVGVFDWNAGAETRWFCSQEKVHWRTGMNLDLTIRVTQIVKPEVKAGMWSSLQCSAKCKIIPRYWSSAGCFSSILSSNFPFWFRQEFCVSHNFVKRQKAGFSCLYRSPAQGQYILSTWRGQANGSFGLTCGNSWYQRTWALMTGDLR